MRLKEILLASIFLNPALGLAADDASKPAPRAPAPAKDASLQPTFSGDKATVTLPGPIDTIILGGGGRFVIGHIRGQRKLVIVDVLEAKVAKVLELPPGNISFSAGRDKLMIAEKEAGIVTRWSLKTFEKEASVSSLVEGPIKTIVMGCDAVGPLVVSGEKKSVLLNPNSMKFEGFSWKPPVDHLRPAVMAASADGRAVVGYNDGHDGPAVLLTVSLDKIMDRRESIPLRSAASLIPSADGSSLFEAGITPSKMWRPDMTKAAILDLALANASPSLDPAYFVAWAGSKESTPKAALYSTASRQLLADLGEFEELSETGEIPAWNRLQFNPKSNLLITLGGDNKVVVRKFDLMKTLEAQGKDYLFVTSSAPSSVMKGKPLNYPIGIKSKRGGVKYSIEEGPKGMTISPAGALRWQVPPLAKEIEVMVTVKVVDASEHTLFHEFVISLLEAPKKPTQTAGKGAKPDNRGFMDRALGPIDKLRQNQRD